METLELPVNRGPKPVRDCSLAREAYISRSQRPTYEELAVEFAIPQTTVSRAAADEGWQLARLRKAEMALQQSDVAEALVEAAKGEREILEAFRRAVVVLVLGITSDAEAIESEKMSRRTRSSLRQSATFSLLNCAQALKAVGLVGLPKGVMNGLAGGGDDKSAPWLKGMLQSITVNLNGAANAQSQKAEIIVSDKPTLSAEIPQAVGKVP